MSTQQFKVFVGIDIGAAFHVVTILTVTNADTYRSAKCVRFFNSIEGFLALQEQLDRASRDPAEFKVALEPTGGWYPAALLHYLTSRGYACYYVNNGAVKNYAWAQGIESKTDELDSRVLAHMAYAITCGSTLYGMRPVPQLDCATAHIRELSRYRWTISVARGRCINQLHQFMTATFPEMLLFFRTGPSSASCQQLLKAFPTPAALVKAGVEPVRLLLRSCKAIVHAKRAPELIELARTSAGRSPSPGLLTRQAEVLRNLMEYTQALAVLDHDLANAMHQHPWGKIFVSFPCYSPIWAATLTSVIVDVNRFRNGRAFRRAMGWAPREKSSGQSRARARLGRAGSRDARRVLYQWVFSLVSPRAKANAFRIQYQRLLARGKEPKIAMGHVCGKLLGVLYACLKKKKVYKAKRHYQALKAQPPAAGPTKPRAHPRRQGVIVHI